METHLLVPFAALRQSRDKRCEWRRHTYVTMSILGAAAIDDRPELLRNAEVGAVAARPRRRVDAKLPHTVCAAAVHGAVRRHGNVTGEKIGVAGAVVPLDAAVSLRHLCEEKEEEEDEEEEEERRVDGMMESTVG